MTRKKSPAQPISMLVLQKREIAAAEFKARCLELMDEVHRLGIEVTITKHRRPVARLVPALRESTVFCGSMRDRISYEGEIVAPIGVGWNAEQNAHSA